MLRKNEKYHIAIAGATGAVGRKMLAILEERNVSVDDLKLLASTRSAGKFLEFKGEKIAVEDPSAMSHEMKKICKLFGADLVGITDFDERWHYSQRVDTRDHTPTEPDLPPGMTHVIVLGHSMDYELVRTYPSALAGASTGLEYSRETSIVIHLSLIHI